jgi:hypothetical protein
MARFLSRRTAAVVRPNSHDNATSNAAGRRQFWIGLLLGTALTSGLGFVTTSWAQTIEATGAKGVSLLQQQVLESLRGSPSRYGHDNNNNDSPTQSKPSSLADDSRVGGVEHKEEEEDNPPPGWKSIHVFYNDRNAGLQLTGIADQDPKWFSQVHQDEIVANLLGGKEGYFIDLAANDAKEFSNTLALERSFDWNGLCVEPNSNYWYGLSHRKCTVVGALVGGDDVSRIDVKFRGVYGGIVGKMDNTMANRKAEPDSPVEQRYTTPLKDVLRQFHVPNTIDYMSLDVEGAELYIMEQFPFDTYTIKLLTIERPTGPLKQLLLQKGYVYLKDLAWWGETLWAHQSMGLSPDHKDIVSIKTV